MSQKSMWDYIEGGRLGWKKCPACGKVLPLERNGRGEFDNHMFSHPDWGWSNKFQRRVRVEDIPADDNKPWWLNDV